MFYADVAFGDNEHARKRAKERYTFQTEAERAAFLDGIDAAVGWFEYQVFDEGETLTTEPDNDSDD